MCSIRFPPQGQPVTVGQARRNPSYHAATAGDDVVELRQLHSTDSRGQITPVEIQPGAHIRLPGKPKRFATVGETAAPGGQLFIAGVDHTALRSGGMMLPTHRGKGGDGTQRADQLSGELGAMSLGTVLDHRNSPP